MIITVQCNGHYRRTSIQIFRKLFQFRSARWRRDYVTDALRDDAVPLRCRHVEYGNRLFALI